MNYNTLQLSDDRKQQNRERMLKIIEWSGLPIYAFSKACKLKSSSSINNIIKKGVTPSEQLISSIVNRFPQLNFDWILTGTGTMLTISSEGNSSDHSQRETLGATYKKIISKIEAHEMALESVFKKADTMTEKMNNLMLIVSENQAMISLKIDKIADRAQKYVEEHAKQNEKGMQAALEMINGFDKRSNAMMNKIEKVMDTIVKSQNSADARADESLKAGIALVESINKTREKGMEMIIAVQKEMKQQAKLAEEATELGYRALKENKEALKSFGRGLEGYAKERDKKAKEITLVNVEKLFKELLEQKGLGTYTKYKKI